MKLALAIALCAVGALASTDSVAYCDDSCVASRMPRTADLEGDLLVPNAFTAGGVNVLGIKGRKAMDVESLHVGKLLKTSLLDADHTQSGELLTPMLQSPTGKLVLEGVASVTGNIQYTSGLSFLEEGEVAAVRSPAHPWRLVHMSEFSGERASGWTFTDGSQVPTTHCGDEQHFLGGHCATSSEPARLVLSDLPPHRELQLRAKFHFIDSWEGETAFAKVDGQFVWVDSHTSRGAGFGVNMCGDAAHPEQRMAVPVDIMVPHGGESVEMVFGATLDEHACNESWGVDQVEVFVR